MKNERTVALMRVELPLWRISAGAADSSTWKPPRKNQGNAERDRGSITKRLLSLKPLLNRRMEASALEPSGIFSC